MSNKKILILPGDGIGNEVMAEVLKIIDWMEKTKSLSFEISERLVGGTAYDKEGNSKYGSGFSIQPKFSQSAYFRFHNKSEVCDGLFFVGAGTHPGAGVPGVLSSAKVLDKII